MRPGRLLPRRGACPSGAGGGAAMSLSFACDFCSREYRGDDGLAGRRVKCKECGTELTIPSSSAVATATKAPPAADLYGLDDEIDGAPPPPRRPGFEPVKAKGKAKGSRGWSSSSTSGENPLRNWGWGLFLFG